MQGIITGANSAFYQGAKLLAYSAIVKQVPICVFDDGLLSGQAEELQAMGAVVTPAPPFPLTFHWTRSMPRETLAKAAKCLASPYQLTAWIDSDAVLVGDPAALFGAAACGPMLTAEAFDPRPTKRFLRSVGFHGPRGNAVCNGGVLAWDQLRDAGLLNEWQRRCSEIAASGDLLRLAGCLDQDALNWAAASLGLLHCIQGGLQCPANMLLPKQAWQRKPYPGSVEEKLAAIEADHPGQHVIHWLGRPKLWELSQI